MLKEAGRHQNSIKRGLVVDPIALPELPDLAATRVRLGERWALGEHRLMCGDATDSATVERLSTGSPPGCS